MARPLRILLISSAYLPESGDSIWTCNACVGEALAARGHEVHHLSCVQGQAARDERYRGTYLHRRGLIRIRGLGRINSLIHAPRTLTRVQIGLSTYIATRRLGVNFDVVDYPDWEAEGLVFAITRERPLVAFLRTPLPLIREYANLPLDRDVHWASALEHFAVRRAHTVTSSSELLITTLRQIGWEFPAVVEIIPEPVDLSFWSGARPVAETDPVVLYVGTIERRKAPEVLVEAMGLIRRTLPHAKAIFAGGSNGQRDGLPYLKWLLQSRMTTACEFLGHIPREQLQDIISTARVLAVPSRFDSYSLVAAEAMAAGRPVVVTSTSGISELVKETRAGAIVPPEDPQSLADALLPFLTDVSQAASAGGRAKVAVREFLDPGRIAAQREAVYYRAIEQFRH